MLQNQRLRVGIGGAVAALALLPAGLTIAGDARVGRIEAAFEAWVTRHDVKNASLAIMIDGAIIGGVGHGSYAPSLPVPVASLSKAITGVCVAKLVEAGKLGFDASLAELLPAFLAKHPPKDSRAKTITVAELLTHTSGIAASGSPNGSLNVFRPFTKDSTERQVAGALSVPLGTAPGATYDYNNINYAALGLIIETVAGKSYEDYCRETVLVPAGAKNAIINPEWRVMGPYGGWKISAEDYARFLRSFDPGTELLTIAEAAWPKAKVKNGGFYGIGVGVRPVGNGFNLSHFGGWTWNGKPRASFGAYFAVWLGGVTLVATYAPLPKGAGGDLARSLRKAAFP
jgi:CubicO group peptidase (beta-lactamase class C family)